MAQSLDLCFIPKVQVIGFAQYNRCQIHPLLWWRPLVVRHWVLVETWDKVHKKASESLTLPEFCTVTHPLAIFPYRPMLPLRNMCSLLGIPRFFFVVVVPNAHYLQTSYLVPIFCSCWSFHISPPAFTPPARLSKPSSFPERMCHPQGISHSLPQRQRQTHISASTPLKTGLCSLKMPLSLSPTKSLDCKTM